MKKLSTLISAATYALFVPHAFAAGDIDFSVPGNIPGTISPGTSVGKIVGFAVAFIIVIATLAALLYIVIGAFQWITSGGDKQKVADARNHILAAIIGLIVIALSFVIINVVISALGLGSLTNLKVTPLQ